MPCNRIEGSRIQFGKTISPVTPVYMQGGTAEATNMVYDLREKSRSVLLHCCLSCDSQGELISALFLLLCILWMMWIIRLRHLRLSAKSLRKDSIPKRSLPKWMLICNQIKKRLSKPLFYAFETFFIQLKLKVFKYWMPLILIMLVCAFLHVSCIFSDR